MKNYREVADDVLRRSEEIIADRRRKKKIGIKIGTAAACFVLVVLLGVGIWSRPKTPQPGPSDVSKNTTPSSREPIRKPPTGSAACQEWANPVNIISSYKEASEPIYDPPENGKAILSTALQSAMAEYGDEEYTLFSCAFFVYRDGRELACITDEDIAGETELYTRWNREQSRLQEAGLNAGMSVCIDLDTQTEYAYFSMYATKEELENFPVSEEYGYLIYLSDEDDGAPNTIA